MVFPELFLIERIQYDATKFPADVFFVEFLQSHD